MENEEKKPRKSTAKVRRASTHGQTLTKTMTFKVDKELLDALNKEPNKGRLINDLLHKHYGI